MMYATLTQTGPSTGHLIVTDDRMRTLAETDVTAENATRWAVVGEANQTLPRLGFELDYGWMSEWVGNNGLPVFGGKVVRAGDRVSVWD
jgi:hypothetical protein